MTQTIGTPDLAPSAVDAQRMLRLLGNSLVEIRAIRGRDVSGEYFSDHGAAAARAVELSQAGYNVYATVNQLATRLGSCVGQGATTNCTKNDDVTRLKHLVLDIDPVRWTDQKGCAATDAEHDAALLVANAVTEFSAKEGLPEPAVIDSGNGFYVGWRIDFPNDKFHQTLIKNVLEGFARRFNNPNAEIDTCVGNPARIFRLAGTVNRKGDSTIERPHRCARIISAPPGDRLLELTVDKLQAFEFANPDRRDVREFQNALRPRVTPEQHQQQVNTVLAYLNANAVATNGQKHEADHTLIKLAYCTKEPQQDDGNTGILVRYDGVIGYKCFHGKCTTVTWEEYQQSLPATFDDYVAGIAARETLGEEVDQHSYDDPIVLAKLHAKKWATPSGEATLAFFRGETHRYDALQGWQRIKDGALDPWIRDTIQEAFNKYASERAKLTGKKVPPKKVGTQLVKDVYKAMQSLSKYDVSRTTQPPFWLKPHAWKAEDLLVFRNGILNVRHYIEGATDYFMDKTPRLYFEHAADFDCDPAAPKPVEWFKLLDSLEVDATWRDCLQEMFGYCLWWGWDLQKYFMLVGPPRSGKGTMIRVLSALVGGAGAVCSPNLCDLVKGFGLQQVIGKQLAIVPEVIVPNQNAKQIVAQLKAWTGGDLMTVDHKYGDIVSLRLSPTRIIMQSNDFVPLPDDSGALHARLVPLKMTKSFVGQERPELAESLVQEYPEILLWALDGLKRLRTNNGRFSLPETSLELIDSLSSAASPLQEFLEDSCEDDLNAAVQTSALYGIYEEWMQLNREDEPVLRASEFGSALRATRPLISEYRPQNVSAARQRQVEIMKTRFDKQKIRPRCWRGIRPASRFLKVELKHLPEKVQTAEDSETYVTAV